MFIEDLRWLENCAIMRFWRDIPFNNLLIVRCREESIGIGVEGKRIDLIGVSLEDSRWIENYFILSVRGDIPFKYLLAGSSRL